jgi:hypothetical protein
MEIGIYVLAIIIFILLIILIWCMCYHLIKYYTSIDIKENEYELI